MKKSILLPLFLGLMLAGCNRTESEKTAANDSNTPNYDKSATANVTSNSTTTNSAMATGKSSSDSSSLALNTPSTTSEPAASSSSQPTANTPPSNTSSSSPTSTSTDIASTGNDSKSSVSAHLTEWKLTSDDIRNEVKAGRVERSRTQGAGEPTGPMDDVLVSSINGKLKNDTDTAALKIDVKAEKGVVTLSGSAQSLDQIGKAMALALDTSGVTQAVSEIKLENATTP